MIRDVVRFYVMEDPVTKKRFGGLGRWSEEGDDLFVEMLDRENKWVDCPLLLSACGIGGGDTWVELNQHEAQLFAGPGVNIWPVSSTPST